MKPIAFLPAALIAVAAPATAGPYVNVEANSSFVGNDYSATVLDNHVGFKQGNWYVQAGPSIVAGTVLILPLNCLARLELPSTCQKTCLHMERFRL